MESLFYKLGATIDTDPLPQPTTTLSDILSVVFVIAGSVALLVLVIGGFRYIISRGDPSATAQAKNTIIYGLIGLVVVVVATSIVALVVSLT